MPGTTTVSLKCKMCGGDLVNDYLSGSCVCKHCGNKYSLEELIPDFATHANAIAKIKNANDLLGGEVDATSAGQAKLLFKTAESTCNSSTSAIAGDLAKLCKEGMARSEELRRYATGKKYFDKKNYRAALNEFKHIPGVRDVDEMTSVCQVEVEKSRIRRIPYDIIVSMILPTILVLFLKMKVGLALPISIPIGVVLTAALAFAVYKEGGLGTFIQIVSIASAVPLLLFLILAFGFGLAPKKAALSAIIAPIALIILLALKPERIVSNGAN